MNTSAVVDTGPLLVLHQIGLLPLLRNLYQKILIPEAVKNELVRGPIGQVVLASGLVEVKPFIRRMLKKGYYLSKELINKVLIQLYIAWYRLEP